MQLALLAMLPLVLFAPAQAPAQRPRAAVPATGSTSVATITVTDLSGAPVPDVQVSLKGALDRLGTTQSNGTVKFDGLRAGTYRLRFEHPRFVLFEREIEWRAGQPAPNPSVALSPAAATPPPPAAPEPAKASPPPEAKPPGRFTSLNVPDFIERNFITNTQPQKVSAVSCSGAGATVLWQVREAWDNRQHADAEAMLYVIGGEGTLRIDGRDTSLAAGSFAQVPRGTSYSLSRRGRNPVLIVLATLVGEGCP